MNKVYAILGPAGSGKSALVQELRRRGIPKIVSHTTRPPKPGEADGVDYHFVSSEEFAKVHPFEKVSYGGYLYGLSKEEVMEKVNKYTVSIVDVDMEGVAQLKKLLGARLESIFLLVDKDTIFSRFMLHGDKLEDVKRRIEQAEALGEFDNWQSADYVVKNTGPMEVALLQLLAIMGQVKIPGPA